MSKVSIPLMPVFLCASQSWLIRLVSCKELVYKTSHCAMTSETRIAWKVESEKPSSKLLYGPNLMPGEFDYVRLGCSPACDLNLL